MKKRLVRAVASVVLVLIAGGYARAAGFPERRIEIVVPVTPGSATDLLARMVAEKLSERVSQPVVVANKPGAAILRNTRRIRLMLASHHPMREVFVVAARHWPARVHRAHRVLSPAR